MKINNEKILIILSLIIILMLAGNVSATDSDNATLSINNDEVNNIPLLTEGGGFSH